MSTVTRPLAGSKMSMPARGSVFVFQKRRRYSLLSLFMKWTLPVHGATSTLPLGLGAWSRMVIVADRGRVTCLALAAPVVDTVVLLSNLTASRGAGNLGQRGARAGRAVAEDPSESSHS